jgi:hypothetical protein
MSQKSSAPQHLASVSKAPTPDRVAGYLALTKTPIEGPAGVEADFEFRAAFNATATRMMTAVLKNQQAGTEYA